MGRTRTLPDTAGAVGENPSALCCCYPWAGGASALLAFAEINILIQNESRI